MTQLVLGIDAAWTETEPSGVALLCRDDSNWRCAGLAPSYGSFLKLAAGQPVNWSERPAAGVPNAAALLQAARRVAGADVDVVAVDMPLASTPIVGRRVADDAISRAFGGRGASTHSPSSQRPGRLSDRLRGEFEEAGFRLATAAPLGSRAKWLVEVYPHAALIHLLGARRRLEYKSARARKYWPQLSPTERMARLLDVWGRILKALGTEVGEIPLILPECQAVRSVAELKRYEDGLDAVVAAWVGARFLAGEVRPYGDETGAIWVPTESHLAGTGALPEARTGAPRNADSRRAIRQLIEALRVFASERDWDQFHTPKDLAMALSVEAAELMEHFQWLTAGESAELDPDTLAEVRDEIGDVLIYLLRLADRLGIDALEAAVRKLEKNRTKYPAERVPGNSTKYTKY